MKQQTASDGGNEVENSERDIEAGDRVRAEDLGEGDIVTPTGDDDAHYEVVKIWREEGSIVDPLRVKVRDDDGNEDVVTGTVSRHYLVESAGESDEVEWESEIEYDSADDEYDRSAQGKLIIDGPDGKLVVLKRYRAMINESKGLMEPGQTAEHSTYYRSDESEPFSDGKVEWDVPEDVLADKDAFVEDCLAAVEADPEVEYEQHSDNL